MISIEQLEKELDLIIKNGYREDLGDGAYLIILYSSKC